jgi:hypothetical protein
MKEATVIIPWAYATRWGMVSVSSLKRYSNNAKFDILVVDNSPGHPSIRAITETRLGEGVKVITTGDPNLVGHQVTLDYCIDLVETPYYVAWETDVRVLRDGWLDWLISNMKDRYTAMAGWLWATAGMDDSRHYISPAGAIYNTEILKLLKEECLRNPDLTLCWGHNMDKRLDLAADFPHTAGKMIPLKLWGPFTECRGFSNIYPFPRETVVSEPGNWIYNRCRCQWECVHLPGAMVVNDEAPPELSLPHKYAYIGPSDKEAYYRHFWAGSVSHNFDKHKIPPWDGCKVPWWLAREYDIWEQEVSKEVRDETWKLGILMTYEEECAYAQSQVKYD